jgi:hypothetical protein
VKCVVKFLKCVVKFLECVEKLSPSQINKSFTKSAEFRGQRGGGGLNSHAQLCSNKEMFFSVSKKLLKPQET